MSTDVHLAAPVSDEDSNGTSKWYMNKNVRSTTVKVLHSVDEGLRRMRPLQDILGGQSSSDTRQPHLECPMEMSVCSLAIATIPECQESSDVATVKKMALPETDEEDEMGKMTLREVHRLLRRNMRKSLKQERCVLSSSVRAPVADSNLGNKDFNCATQLGVLELHLDSSTSNSAESGDDMSPRGVATSCHKPEDCGTFTCETVTRKEDGLDLSRRKQNLSTGSSLFETGVSVEDDECTLQMWQAHRQRVRGGKRLAGSSVEQSGSACLAMYSPIPLSSVPAAAFGTNPANDGADSTSSLPGITQCLPDALIEENLCAIPSFAQPVANLESSEKASFKSMHDAVADQDLIGNALVAKDMQKKSGDFCEEDDQMDSMPRIPTAQSKQIKLEGSSRDQNSDGNTLPTSVHSWACRPCKATTGFKFHLKETNTHRIAKQPLTLSSTPQDLDGRPGPIVRSPEVGDVHIRVDNNAGLDSPYVDAATTRQRVTGSAMTLSEVADVRIGGYCPDSGSANLALASAFDTSPSSAGLEQNQDTDSLGPESLATVCQSSGEEMASPPPCLFSALILDKDEEPESEQLKPSKIPCKRKAISPLSREKLLRASRFGECERTVFEVEKRGLKKLPRAFKGFIGRDSSNHRSNDAFRKDRGNLTRDAGSPVKPTAKADVLPGSPCHNRKKYLCATSFAQKASRPSPQGGMAPSTAVGSDSIPSEPTPSCVQRLSLVLDSSPYPRLQNISKPIHSKSPPSHSPSFPTKGILRSSPPSCRGACKCEECESLRCRAERAAEFSQRQMQDIEGLAVRLLKELNSMRYIVEDSLVQRPASKAGSPHSASSSEQARRAANNALETEKMAKSWLVRMARDCNRYCKIMRMQERKLTFADQSGGQLCHVKVFHSQSSHQLESSILNTAKENMPLSPCNRDSSTEAEVDMKVS